MVKLGPYNVHIPMTIPKDVLSANALGLRGGYGTGNTSTYFEVDITTSSAKLIEAKNGGNDVLSSCETTVYYK